MKRKYDLVVFDLDGTLLDTADGIVNCLNFALKEVGMETMPSQKIKQTIGSPFSKIVADNKMINQEVLINIQAIYRDKYKTLGIKGAKRYTGIIEVLKYLQASGYKTAVATLKVESGALAILKAHDMDKYFDLIYGVDVNNTYSKADLVQKAMTILNIPPNKTILVGDTVYDLQGADIAKVDFLAVTYGFGFSLQNLDLLNNKALIAHHPQDIIKKLESVVS